MSTRNGNGLAGRVVRLETLIPGMVASIDALTKTIDARSEDTHNSIHTLYGKFDEVKNELHGLTTRMEAREAVNAAVGKEQEKLEVARREFRQDKERRREAWRILFQDSTGKFIVGLLLIFAIPILKAFVQLLKLGGLF
ncbi:hypothetical protein HY496_02740 [Candidatus Woesearchaeota archaeon]|nr:hypothetical protein [Candidatus Woesearchaeota archaeon]